MNIRRITGGRMTGCDCGWGGYCEWCRPEMFDAGREFTPSEAEAIHRAMVREDEQEKACQK